MNNLIKFLFSLAGIMTTVAVFSTSACDDAKLSGGAGKAVVKKDESGGGCAKGDTACLTQCENSGKTNCLTTGGADNGDTGNPGNPGGPANATGDGTPSNSTGTPANATVDATGNSTTGGDSPSESTGGSVTKPPFNWSGSGYLAFMMDAHTASLGGNGGQPVQIFPTQDFSVGKQTMYLMAATGTTIFRYNHGNPEGQMACGGVAGYSQWFVYFKDANGALIGNFSQLNQDRTYSMTAYSAGVPVPPGAKTAWLGFFDNAQTGDGSSYDDNEGGGRSGGGSTNGCSFSMQVRYN